MQGAAGMIATVDHSDIRRRVAPAHVERLRDILAALDLSRGPEGMNLPGFRLHELKGALKGRHAVSNTVKTRTPSLFRQGLMLYEPIPN